MKREGIMTQSGTVFISSTESDERKQMADGFAANDCE